MSIPSKSRVASRVSKIDEEMPPLRTIWPGCQILRVLMTEDRLMGRADERMLYCRSVHFPVGEVELPGPVGMILSRACAFVGVRGSTSAPTVRQQGVPWPMGADDDPAV